MAQINNAGDNIRYKSPQVKVVVLNSRHVLCQSHVTLYEKGSDTNGGDMDEEVGW